MNSNNIQVFAESDDEARRDNLPGCHASVVATTPAQRAPAAGDPLQLNTPEHHPPRHLPPTPECAAINIHGSDARFSFFLSSRLARIDDLFQLECALFLGNCPLPGLAVVLCRDGGASIFSLLGAVQFWHDLKWSEI